MIPSLKRITLALLICLLLPVDRMHSSNKPQSNSPEQIIHRIEQTRGHRTALSEDIQSYTGKCGLRLSFDVMEHWKEFTASQKELIMKLLAPPVRQKNRIIGHFTIFYDTTGVDAPALVLTGSSTCQPIPGTAEAFVDSTGKFFNHVWDYEIDTLGYAAPPLQADNTYWVDVGNLGYGLYGETFPDMNAFDPGPPARYNTHIEIDNDFCGVYQPSRGIPGLQVTCAHEFHHAIQLGAYGTWGQSDFYFNEITSTWMEDVVYTDVNDYYQYLFNTPCSSPCSQFSTPDARFSEYNGSIEYSRSIWGKFIEKRFSRDIMLHTWEYERRFASVPAIDQALADAGSSFRQAFLEWALWNENTGPNCDTVKYYAEGRNYPTMRLKDIVQYDPPQKVLAGTLDAVSSVYHQIFVNHAPMMVIISNINTAPSAPVQNDYSFVVANDGDDSYKHLSNGVYVKLNVADPANWSDQESVPTVVNDVVVFPDPFVSKGSNVLSFRLPPVVNTQATLTIFSITLDRIISKDLPINESNPSEPLITWSGYDERNDPTPSGIYFYVITVDDKQYSGKFLIVRK